MAEFVWLNLAGCIWAMDLVRHVHKIQGAIYLLLNQNGLQTTPLT